MLLCGVHKHIIIHDLLIYKNTTFPPPTPHWIFTAFKCSHEWFTQTQSDNRGHPGIPSSLSPIWWCCISISSQTLSRRSDCRSEPSAWTLTLSQQLFFGSFPQSFLFHSPWNFNETNCKRSETEHQYEMSAPGSSLVTVMIACDIYLLWFYTSDGCTRAPLAALCSHSVIMPLHVFTARKHQNGIEAAERIARLYGEAEVEHHRTLMQFNWGWFHQAAKKRPGCNLI